MNPQELTTKQDLQQLEQSLIKKFSELLKIEKPMEQQWLKSRDVKKLLGISSGTLQTMRINAVLPFSKLNGTLYYRYEDVQAALSKNLQNA